MAEKEKILERYRLADGAQFVIDIAAGRIEDLYDNFDKRAPYLVKELDTNLVEYITESARELINRRFSILFAIEIEPDETVKSRTRESVRNYFLYLKETQVRGLRHTLRKSLTFFITGLAIMFVSVWVNQGVNEDTAVIGKVFAEGLTVASWVAMWEAVANLLIKWRPYRKNMKLYEQIAQAEVGFPGADKMEKSGGIDI